MSVILLGDVRDSEFEYLSGPARELGLQPAASNQRRQPMTIYTPAELIGRMQKRIAEGTYQPD
jgi:hypothetical protein